MKKPEDNKQSLGRYLEVVVWICLNCEVLSHLQVEFEGSLICLLRSGFEAIDQSNKTLFCLMI